MPTYHANEAVFTLPEWGFVDRTIHRLESPLTGDVPLSVTLRRLPLEEGKSLRQSVDEEVATSAAKAQSYRVASDVEADVAGAPAILLRARWRTGDVAQYQVQAHVALDGTWVALAVTGPHAERAACDETFDRIVHTLDWRRD